MSRSRLRRILQNVVLISLAVFLGALLAIQVEQHLFRRRAEQLLSNIRSLDLGKATFADEQNIFRRWHGSVHHNGNCTETDCEVEVYLPDFFTTHILFFITRVPVVHPYLLIGGRPAQVRALIGVHENVVWSKSFDVDFLVPGYRFREGDWPDYSLVGEATSIPTFAPFKSPALHPEFVIGSPGGCTFCIKGYVHFTAHADPAEIRRLMDFDLSCLTRIWHTCRSQVDIMPAAWSQHQRELGREGSWEGSDATGVLYPH